MSSITNRIATVFTASAGNVKAVMGEVAGGMQNIGRAATETGRNTGIANNQLRAIATTMRYALAGSVIFGTTALVRNVSALQTQVALWDTLSDSVGNAGSRLNELQRGSVQSLTPVNDLANSVTNLLSSVQGVEGSQITRITTMLAEGAQFAQTPVEDLTKAVTSMNQAFGRTPSEQNFEGLTKGFVTLTRRAPGGVAAGQQIINQLGPLAAVSRLGNISPEQMFGMLTTVLRFGGTPSTGARGLQFLLQSITAPTGQHAKVLAGLGITPDLVQQKGGAVRAIEILIKNLRQRGVTGGNRLKGLSDEQLDEASAAGQTGLAQLGISGGGIQLAQQAIGRIHGVRALVALMSEMNTPHGNMFSQDIQAAADAMAGIGENGRPINDQFKEFARKQPLRQASIALSNMSLQAGRAIGDLLNPVAHLVGRAGEVATNHPRGAHRVALGAAGFLGALGLSRAFGLKLPGLGRFAGQGGSLFTRERAVEAAIDPARSGVLGGAPQNPMYVTVVGQLFGGGTPGGGGGGGNTPPGFIGRLGKFGRFGKVGIGLGLGEAALAAAATAGALKLGDITTPQRGKDYSFGDLGHDAKRLLGFAFANGPSQQERQRNAIQRANRNNPEIDRLNRVLAPFHRRDPLYGVTAIYSQRRQMINGHAEVVLDVNLSTDKGLVHKKIHVPMNLWSGGRNPGTRGQPGKTTSKVP